MRGLTEPSDSLRMNLYSKYVSGGRAIVVDHVPEEYVMAIYKAGLKTGEERYSKADYSLRMLEPMIPID